jgi:hypothetical protein
VGATSKLAEASGLAFKAIGKVDDFVLKAKHLPGGPGKSWSKFADGVDYREAIREALGSSSAAFLPNSEGRSGFVIITDLGRQIGSKGQTGVKVVLDEVGEIVTAYPFKPIVPAG